MAKSLKPSFSDVGLPDGHAFPELAYHQPTGSIIAHTRPRESRLPSHRLSIRRVNEARYSVIGDFPPSISVSSFALSSVLPILYFITFSWSDHGGNVGGDWDALYRFSLDTHQCEVVARRGELVPPDHYRSAWLSELFSVNEDGRSLFCKAALQRAGEAPIDYCLSELSIADLRLAVITRLEAVFA
jgi:hypothetical protein